MELVRFQPQHGLEIRGKKDDENTMRIGGYGLRWSETTELYAGWYEAFERGSFPEEARPDVRLLTSHEGLPLARTASGTMDIREDKEGLAFEARLDLRDPDALAVSRKIERGDLDGVSIGFLRQGGESKLREDEDGNVYETFTRVGQLVELSLVSFPAYATSEVGLRALPEVPAELRARYDAQRDAGDAPARETIDTRSRILRTRIRLLNARASAHKHGETK